ncbi:MAG TPA: DUF488 domain-containing protein [Sedimentisphaerales bacterium]|nr:DUF488 domain-containing protein [Sedimentisphaerales bacterium]HUU15614.1 DUF488 domain-containing protein [Sedimentisphaerales bacterium]
MKTKKRKTIYNVGYQGKTPEGLIAILKKAGVTLLVDLRERPFSRIAGFNQKRFSLALNKQEIQYLWLGQILGGFTCTKDQWLEGCKRLVELSESYTVAIMCMEADYSKCHRNDIAGLLAFFHNIDRVNL